MKMNDVEQNCVLYYFVDVYSDPNLEYDEYLHLRERYADAMEDNANSVEDTQMYV